MTRNAILKNTGFLLSDDLMYMFYWLHLSVEDLDLNRILVMNSNIRISQLACLAFYINGAAGSARYSEVTLDECYTALGNGTIFKFLESRLGRDFDSSLLEEEQKQELIEEWEGYANVVDHRRKYMIEEGGLNLVVAYLLESIQQRSL